MKFNISNRHLDNSKISFKFVISERWKNNLTKCAILLEEGKFFSLLQNKSFNLEKFDDSFFYKSDKISKIFFPILVKVPFFKTKDIMKNKELFQTISSIIKDNNLVNIKQLENSQLWYKVTIKNNDFIKIFKEKNNNKKINELFIWTLLKYKRWYKNIYKNLKYLFFEILYSSFPNIQFIRDNKLFNSSKINFLLSKKSLSPKEAFFKNILGNLLYFSYLKFFKEWTNKLIKNEILVKILKKTFEGNDKDLNNKDNYLELITKIENNIKLKSGTDFYQILDIILILSFIWI